jgi:ER membrane protein complex subunit 3
MAEPLTLSPEIKNFVLLPIVLVTFLVNLGRTYTQQLIASQKVQDKEKAGYVQTLQRSKRTRASAGFLRPEAFRARQTFFSAKKTGVLCNPDVPGAVNPMMQQGGAAGGGAMDMMKNQMTFMVPNMVMMAGMNYFFSGFVIARVPFPLAPRFKMMLQQGINLQSLDPSYVSALSWYFLVMFGIRGVMGLFLNGSAKYQDMHAMQMQMQMGMGAQPGAQFDAKKEYTSERDAFRVSQHIHFAEAAERRLVGMKVD